MVLESHAIHSHKSSNCGTSHVYYCKFSKCSTCIGRIKRLLTLTISISNTKGSKAQVLLWFLFYSQNWFHG